MIKARRLRYATFETPDLNRAVEYYTCVVGLTVADRDKHCVFLAARAGQLAIKLEQAAQERCRGLTFEIAPQCDLAAIADQLSQAGITSEERRDPAPGIASALSFEDPKGTSLELVCGPVPLTGTMKRSGIGPLKLGHVAFFTPDPRSIGAFYQQVLGFRVSDWIEDFFLFMRCDADHHAVNFLRGDEVRMHHCAFELRDAGHIRDACDLLAQHGIPLVYGPVRFGPGHNLAVFHRNSDGQLVEFYAELDQMKDEELGYFEPRPWHRDRPQQPKTWTLSEDPIWGPPPPAGFM